MTRKRALALSGLALAFGACGGLGEPSERGDTVTVSFLVDNSPQSLASAEALAKGFSARNRGVAVEVETRPPGSEGDNIVKTRLATGEMSDVFLYNSGSLLQALNPARNLVPLTGEPWMRRVDRAFIRVVSAAGEVFGAPFGGSTGGGILYNRTVYERLGLRVPRTWAEFMANNARIRAAGIDPVIQTFQDPWTSQLLVLADFHNVAALAPGWAVAYTRNRASYARAPALDGFQHLEDVYKAGLLNEDYRSARYEDGLRRLATGRGAHYPMLTSAVAEIANAYPDGVDEIGFFALPGRDAETNGVTLWYPNAVYIPRTTSGATLVAAKKFAAFVATPEACRILTAAKAVSGPFAVQGCALPADVPPAIRDLQPYIDAGDVTPALEFLSPVKGPALQQITVEVGSGVRSARSGAELYDQDVAKQARQLGLEGW